MAEPEHTTFAAFDDWDDDDEDWDDEDEDEDDEDTAGVGNERQT